ncbi:epidermal growth factor receptor substrate 15-like 1 isoform X1 [Diprion similis]|uniref:epidermal growth factor receptor substrate 15-like 1 isoform X1 n=2 Tax=Diprion similis TaxID=362088 RepID=UPI001EF8A3CA|nr:epidermal growth factor receptor substrate 15-like 1 isoform X1 [Diprion similis]
MAALPSPTQVAGSHSAIYEAYYHQVDPNGYGRIGAMEAARFLKKSQLSDVVLSKIWDMADPQSRGSLDKSGLFVALKLCALAQAGSDLSMANLNIETLPPKMGEIPVIPQKPKPISPAVITSMSNGDWSIKPSERTKYDQLFDSLQPANGYIPGNKVKGVLMDSKLPLDTLGKIWDLADMDKDGMLDRHEFVIAMHLVYKALEKYAIPNVLPPELMPPGKRKDIMSVAKSPVPPMVSGPPPIPPLPTAPAPSSLAGLESTKPPAVQHWVISAEDQAAADKLFAQADMDMDGYVSGSEIKDVFLQSGLPQTVLAQIWGLCDICQSGKLNKEQFALSMWLIKQQLRGKEPPATLTPEMIPPSLRKLTENVVENNNVSGYSNPELDMISKDIADLVRERHTMEQDIAQKEADIKIKNGEIKSLQSELDTLAATLKQLENQKGEAQKRLNDLKAQRADVDKELSEIEHEIREEQDKVDKLRQQAEEQESVLRTQEEELSSKRQELEGLRLEEQQLEQQQVKSKDQLNELTKNLQDTQLQISQAKVKITHLEEQQRQMSDAIALYDSALAAGDASLVPDTTLRFEPEFQDPQFKLDDDQSPVKVNGFEDKHADPFSSANGPTQSGSFNGDPFASNKAKEAFSAQGADPFGNSFNSQPSAERFPSDLFTAFNNSGNEKQDPFDPFGDEKRNNSKSPATGGAQAVKDPFGDDPFANLHAPARPESPSPALPPKKAKQPPPRPAPPRPSQGPTAGLGAGPMRAAPAPPTPSPTPDPFVNANSDPFAAPVENNNNEAAFTTSTSSNAGFADFANFDAKPEPVPSRLAPPRPASRPLTTTTSASAPKLPDFTEDPFRDYRYEDPFNITDPFQDETEDSNANKKSVSTGKLDPFGFETDTRFSGKDSFPKGFDSDFSNTFPLTKNKPDSKIVNKFDTDFGSAFSDTNKNTKAFEADFANNFVDPKSKTNDINDAFTSKLSGAEKVSKKSGLDLAHTLKDKLSFGDKKNRNNKTWNGNGGSIMLTEEQQLALAAQQSLRAEEERRRRREQEDADLALALELSRQEKSGKF